MKKTILIERTKKGYPAMWESGGGYTNTGKATIIAGKDGKTKDAIYIRKRGRLANEKHALIPVEVGDYVIEVDHHREDFIISVMKIVDIEEQEEKTLGSSIENLTTTEYDTKYPPFESLGIPVSHGVNGYPIKRLPDGNYVMAKGCNEIWGYTIYPEVEKTEMYVTLETFAEYSMGEWDREVPTFLLAAIVAAKEKATCYHCREPHFIFD